MSHSPRRNRPLVGIKAECAIERRMKQEVCVNFQTPGAGRSRGHRGLGIGPVACQDGVAAESLVRRPELPVMPVRDDPFKEAGVGPVGTDP